MTVLGHIGARKGSKGVPGKNFARLHGKPLIDWSLDQLFSNPRVSAVVVSTDDEAIFAHALQRGALDIGLRPAELATDQAPKWGVWQHALATAERVLAERGLSAVSAFLDLDCTAPLRSPADIEGVLDLFEREQPDLVMSVCEARKNPYFNLVEPDDSGSLRVSKSLPGGIWTRQQAPTVFEHVGVAYAIKPSYLHKASSLYEGRVLPFLVPPERCLDIDSPLDFKLVEWLLGQQLEARDHA